MTAIASLETESSTAQTISGEEAVQTTGFQQIDQDEPITKPDDNGEPPDDSVKHDIDEAGDNSSQDKGEIRFDFGLAEQIFWLLSLQDGRYQRGHTMRLAKSIVETINEINDKFIHTRMLTQARVVNIFSTHGDPAKRVFDEYTATLGISFEHRLPSAKPHLELADAKELDTYTSGITPDEGWLNDYSTSLRKLLYQASPIYPSRDRSAVMDISELDAFVKTNYNRIVHIQCTSGADVVSERVRNYLDANKDTEKMLLYFHFKGHDVRFNTIEAMLWTVSAQIVFNWPDKLKTYLEAALHSLDKEQPREFRTLFEAWSRVGFKYNTVSGLYVLGCLDECDDSALKFLSQIHARVTNAEGRLKIVIITTKGTTKDELITNALSKFPPDTIARIDYSLPSPVSIHTEFEVAMLLQGDPQYSTSGLHDDVRALISGYSNDEALCRILIEWLKSSQTPLESVTLMLRETRTHSVEPVFEAILAYVPEKHHTWAQKILSWMLSSFRPLRTFEFCYISYLLSDAKDKANVYSGEPNTRRRLTDILRHFGGLLVVVHDDVQFAHASLRSWLKSLDPKQDQPSPAEEWYRQTTERNRHALIVQTCLGHLQEDIDPTGAWASYLPYATQFWVEHYKQAGPIENALEIVFEHQLRLERWIDAYIALPTPSLKPMQINPEPLPIAAHFGLEDFVKALLANANNETESLGRALVEATRAAQLPVLRLIIEWYPGSLNLNDIYVQDALLAAAYCGNLELYRELVNRIQKEETIPQVVNEPPNWLMRVLCRTCWLDAEDIVASLLSFGNITLLRNVPFKDGVPLYIASELSHMGVVKRLIAAGASLTADTGSTALHAATHGPGDITDFLLEQGVPIDAESSYEWTPLQLACHLGNLVAVESLLRHRDFQEYLTPDLPDQPLLLAVTRGYYKVTEALLRHGADPNVQDQEGSTALWEAISSNRVDICRLLLAHKADPNLVSEHARSPLLNAVIRNNMDIIKLLVEYGADVNRQESNFHSEFTPIYLATLNNQFENVQYFLSQNADPNITNDQGYSPLWVAAQRGYPDIARLLAEANADVHFYDKQDEWTPLHIVSDSPETVRVLLEYGADVNRATKAGNTPLDLAITDNQYRVIGIMLNETKNKPDLSLSSTQAALRRAVVRGYNEVVSLLLEAGADVNLVDEGNTSLLAFAMPLDNEAMVRTILEHCPDLSIRDNKENTVLHEIERKTPVASVRLAVNAGAKLDTLSQTNWTPLGIAVLEGNEQVVSYLLTKKAVIDTLSISAFKDIGTPLHTACQWGTLSMVKLLTQHGSDLNFACPSAMGSPLMTATRRNDIEEKDEIIKHLLLEGADPDPALPAGLFGYPIMTASFRCSAEIVRWLLDRKVSIDVKDAFGRKAVHFACYNSLEVLNTLEVPDSDFAVKDLVGRVPLHFAVLSGRLDLVKEVLARSERVGVGIDARDNDGWTPLLWAARAAPVSSSDQYLISQHYDVVSFLLDKKADPNIQGRGLYKDWTILEIAYYHNADSIADLVTSKNPTIKSKPGPKKRGKPYERYYCDCCRLGVSGIYFECTDFFDVGLCFKCYRSKSIILPHNKFKELGYDWDADDSVPEAEQLEPAGSTSGKKPIQEEESIDNQFDDEVVDEDDLREQEKDLLEDRNM
ncbi:ankyrin repeat-containing domain [Trichoderma arundinaceum]|uniref:Ankyrin repeat-containing domain n=1 Tax=Trichoderma arundinaceum TaxID=490622 RepID=A0A395NZJ8_TRIAR|nr:ankyrin repeat-containing domain [Trichoderma arundinaceum]